MTIDTRNVNGITILELHSRIGRSRAARTRPSWKRSILKSTASVLGSARCRENPLQSRCWNPGPAEARPVIPKPPSAWRSA